MTTSEELRRIANEMLQLANRLEDDEYLASIPSTLNVVPFKIGDKVLYQKVECRILSFNKDRTITVGLENVAFRVLPSELTKVPE